TQSRQLLRRMPTMLYPHDDLLTNVTAFRVAHRLIEICLGNDIRLIHILSETSDARFNSQDLERVLADRLSARIFESLLELSLSRRVDDDVESNFTGVTSANDRHTIFFRHPIFR